MLLNVFKFSYLGHAVAYHFLFLFIVALNFYRIYLCVAATLKKKQYIWNWIMLKLAYWRPTGTNCFGILIPANAMAELNAWAIFSIGSLKISFFLLISYCMAKALSFFILIFKQVHTLVIDVNKLVKSSSSTRAIVERTPTFYFLIMKIFLIMIQMWESEWRVGVP